MEPADEAPYMDLDEYEELEREYQRKCDVDDALFELTRD